MSNFVVGLTGGIGSGKSTVAEIFAAHGIEVINADQLARDVVDPGSEALEGIASHFGQDILDSSGELKRQRLREIIFSDSSQRQWLEQLLHPLIADLMKSRLANTSSLYCILESPLLLESEQHELADRVLLVDASEENQLARTLRRDQSDSDTIKAIMASQISREDRRKRADDILENDFDIADLQSKVDTLHQHYSKLAKDYEQAQSENS